jgi:hypothetical protein
MDLAERQEYREYVLEELATLKNQLNTTETVDLSEVENVAVQNANTQGPE